MQPYHDLLDNVLSKGFVQYNSRTKKKCYVLVGKQLTFDLSEGFPALTTRKLPFKNIVGELLGFFRGYDNASKFREIGCNFWDKNANETIDWLNSPYRKGTDDLGRIYGKQWTDWRSYRYVTIDEAGRLVKEAGYKKIMQEGNCAIVKKSVNQLTEALNKLIKTPDDRRIIVSGWRPDEFDMMALPPCHMDYRFVVLGGTVHVVMTIRSWDLFLGGPANIAETALFLHVMARLAGLTPGTVTIQVTNAHIYEDHVEQVKELLTREHFPAPILGMSDNIRQVSEAEYSAFTNIQPTDFWLENYKFHPPIKAEMSA